MYLTYSGIFQGIRESYFRKILHKYARSKKIRLLDFGSGPGDMMILASEFGIKEVYGVDNEERSVELAKERGLDVALVKGDTLPYKKNSFDIIFLQSVLEHVPNPIGMCNNLRGYLKKGGLLIISSPTPGPHFWDDPTHVRPFTPKSFITLSELAEFEVVEINYVLGFLLNIPITASIIYKILNLVPYSLGSNIIGVLKK